jgi:hypothetical protein
MLRRARANAEVMKRLGKIKEQVAALDKDENGWRVATSGCGDRAMYKGDWTMRAAVAMAGIYGNDAVDALYPLLATDSDAIRFAASDGCDTPPS